MDIWTCRKLLECKKLSFWLGKWALCTINNENGNNPLKKEEEEGELT